MGNSSSLYTSAVAKLLISTVSKAGGGDARVRHVLDTAHVNQVLSKSGHDKVSHTIPPGGVCTSSNAGVPHNLNDASSEQDSDKTICAAGSVSGATSASEGLDLHAFTSNLKESTELVKDSVYELVSEKRPDVEFVFFHGLQPDNVNIVYAFWRTWKARYSEECWLVNLLPKLLNGTRREIKPRVVSVSYEKSSQLHWGFMSSPIDQFSTSKNLMLDLFSDEDTGVGQQFLVPVVLVGHDLGGIMIKSLLMKVKKTLAERKASPMLLRNLDRFHRNLSALVFFATPETGYSKLDDKIPAKSSNPSLRFLQVLNQEAARVNENFEIAEFKIPTLRIYESSETNQGNYLNELVIPRNFSTPQSYNHYTAPWEDHFQVCQPTGADSTTARRFAQFVVDIVEELRHDEDFV
ncbi:hypothetical protein Mapa_000372 [Marchantia paleacea]|nr:hypothetical protein Mapa_000372 [Marchantia paleacea]